MTHGGAGGMEKEPDNDEHGNGDGVPSEELERKEGGFPETPNKWMHPNLLAHCLIGTPSSSEDPGVS
ncbi:unnamed protein product, partial [Ectocarpus sp. 4 AP-2014]